MLFSFSPRLFTFDKYRINKSGLANSIINNKWEDYLPIEKENKPNDLFTKLKIEHFHLTTKKQREKGIESNAIVLFIKEKGSFYIFQISDTHEGFTKHKGIDCPEKCKDHIKKALDTLLKEKEQFCRMNPNMFFFNQAFFRQNTLKNSSAGFIAFEDNGAIAGNILKRFIEAFEQAQINPPFTLDAAINKIGINDENERVIEFIKLKIDRKKRFASKEELSNEIAKLKYTDQDIRNKYLKDEHKLLKPLKKPWQEITDKDIIIAMNDMCTSFFNDIFNYDLNPSSENYKKLNRHYKRK